MVNPLERGLKFQLFYMRISSYRPSKGESQWLLMEVYINMPHKVGLGDFCTDLPILTNTTIKHRTTSQVCLTSHI